MVKASLRTGRTDAAVQQTAATVAGQPPATAPAPRPQTLAPAAPRPAAAPVRPVTNAVRPGVIHARGGPPARPAVVLAAQPPAAAPVTRAPARVIAPATPPVTQPAARPTRAPARPATTAAALAPEAPVIDVHSEVVTTETPVEGVTVESINTHATESVEDQLLGAEAPLDPTEAPPVDNAHVAEGAEQFSGGEDAEAAAPPARGAVIVRPPSSIATRQSAPDGGLTGDWGAEDLRFPRLTIVRGSGALSQQFNDGTLLYADQVLLDPPNVAPGSQNPFLIFAPLQIDKGWRESLSEADQQAGLMPRNASTVEEVEQMGGTTQWIGGQKPSFSPSARCILLIEKPENSEHPGFILPFDGRDYAIALFYVSGGDFNAFAKLIYNTAKTVLQMPVLDAAGAPVLDAKNRVQKSTMLHKNFWTMQYAKVQRGNFQVWSPQIRLLAKEETGPEARQYVESLLNQNSEAAQGEQ